MNRWTQKALVRIQSPCASFASLILFTPCAIQLVSYALVCESSSTLGHKIVGRVLLYSWLVWPTTIAILLHVLAELPW